MQWRSIVEEPVAWPNALDALHAASVEMGAALSAQFAGDHEGELIVASGVARVGELFIGIEVRNDPDSGWEMVVALPERETDRHP